jgi:hypothetical protein
MVDGKPGKAREVVSLLTDQPIGVQVVKLDTLTEIDGTWCSMTEAFSMGDALAVDRGTAHPLGSGAMECLGEADTTHRRLNT